MVGMKKLLFILLMLNSFFTLGKTTRVLEKKMILSETIYDFSGCQKHILN